MDNKKKLENCFATVFPQIPANEIPRLSVNNFAEWDSLTNIQLTCVIEEEFDTEISSDEIYELTSFELILDYLNNRNE
jgi:acyl carrier protein